MKNSFYGYWDQERELKPKNFICWNCNANVVSNRGYTTRANDGKQLIYICHNCRAPNIFDSYERQAIGIMPGKLIRKLPELIETIYNEARSCISIGAYTGAVMLFRKILMNLAVEDGAKEGQSFVSYVDYLCSNGLVHKKQIKQADEIRLMGNEANHKIENRTEKEANELLKFVEFLLLNNYEFADKEEKSAIT